MYVYIYVYMYIYIYIHIGHFNITWKFGLQVRVVTWCWSQVYDIIYIYIYIYIYINMCIYMYIHIYITPSTAHWWHVQRCMYACTYPMCECCSAVTWHSVHVVSFLLDGQMSNKHLLYTWKFFEQIFYARLWGGVDGAILSRYGVCDFDDDLFSF